MLVVKNLKLSVVDKPDNRKLLFDNLNFNALPGKILMVRGKNGSGKSTLLRVLAGEIKEDAGSILLDGKDVSGVSFLQRCRDFAYVKQDPERGTLSDFTVLENLCFALNRGQKLEIFRKAVSEKKIEKIKEFLSIYSPIFLSKLNQRVSSLSGGQRQLLSILMNLISDTKVILLDEPTASLDDNATISLMTQLKTWVSEKNLIALMVCHDLSLIERYGDAEIHIGSN